MSKQYIYGTNIVHFKFRSYIKNYQNKVEEEKTDEVQELYRSNLLFEQRLRLKFVLQNLENKLMNKWIPTRLQFTWLMYSYICSTNRDFGYIISYDECEKLISTILDFYILSQEELEYHGEHIPVKYVVSNNLVLSDKLVAQYVNLFTQLEFNSFTKKNNRITKVL